MAEQNLETITQEFETFKNDVESKGYALQEINKECKLYKEGLRFAHIMPDDLWIDSIRDDGSIIEITAKSTEALINYANIFYETAKEAASKTTKKFRATEPTFSGCGVYLIYCGLVKE